MSTFDDLVTLDLGSLSEILAAHFPGVTALSSGEWLGVIELLTARMADECRCFSRDSWKVHTKALTNALDAAVASDAISQHESVIRLLNLSFAMLQQVPFNPEIDILNPEYLLGVFFRELPMSVEEARDLSSDWRALEISQIKRLRLVKNLLSPALGLAMLASEGELDEVLKAWSDVFPSLP